MNMFMTNSGKCLHKMLVPDCEAVTCKEVLGTMPLMGILSFVPYITFETLY